MKSFLMILLVLFLAVIIGGSVFIATFDADKFRPQIVNQLENAIQKPVRLEKIKLGWQSGIALELKGLAVLKNSQSPEGLLKVETASALLELKPLLARQIQIASIYLHRPSVRLVRKADGTFEGMEPSVPRSGPVSAGGETSGQAAALSFLVNQIKINDGEFFLRDLSGKRPMEFDLREIDLTVDNVALDRPIDFKASAAVFSGSQNLNIKGNLTLSLPERAAKLKGFQAVLQLAPMEYKEVLRAVPDIETSGIVFPLGGTLTVEADSLRLDEKGLGNQVVKVRLEDGRARLQMLKTPIEKASLEALVTMPLVTVSKFSAEAARGRVEGRGSVHMANPAIPETAFDVKTEKLSIEELLVTPPAGPQVKGLLSVVTKGTLKGQTPEQIQRTVTADGTVLLEQTVITKTNVLREVFQKLSVIPGLVEKLLERLPPNYQEKLKAEDTSLKTMQIPFSVREGTVRLPQWDVATDSFQVTGSGTYGLSQGTVAGTAMLSIEPDLSGAMIRSVEELRFLTNTKKEIQIPLAIQGQVPKVAVMPDLQSVAAKIAAQKAKEVIGDYFKKVIEGKKPVTEGASVAAPDAATSSSAVDLTKNGG